MKLLATLAIGVFLLVFSVPKAYSADETLVRAVMNEASNQGPRGMAAHAWMFQNRLKKGMNLGSSGLYSAKVSRRLAKEPKWAWEAARKAVNDVTAGKIPDITNGAIYCENVKAFGVPQYVRKGLRAGTLEQCAIIGDVVFWKAKK